MISKESPNNRWGNKVLEDVKKLSWTYHVKERKAWNKLVQKTKTHEGLWCQQKKKKHHTINYVGGSIDSVSRILVLGT